MLDRDPKANQDPNYESCCLSTSATPSHCHLYLVPNPHSLVPFPNGYRMFLHLLRSVLGSKSSEASQVLSTKRESSLGLQAQHHLVPVAILTFNVASIYTLLLLTCWLP